MPGAYKQKKAAEQEIVKQLAVINSFDEGTAREAIITNLHDHAEVLVMEEDDKIDEMTLAQEREQANALTLSFCAMKSLSRYVGDPLLMHITKLDLDFNSLSSIEPVLPLHNLRELRAGNNQVLEIPRDLPERLSQLRFLTLVHNRITAVPANICKLKKLK